MADKTKKNNIVRLMIIKDGTLKFTPKNTKTTTKS